MYQEAVEGVTGEIEATIAVAIGIAIAIEIDATDLRFRNRYR